MRSTHIVKRDSGYVAGWFSNEPAARRFALECNRTVPSDPASVIELDWGVWEAWIAETGVPR